MKNIVKAIEAMRAATVVLEAARWDFDTKPEIEQLGVALRDLEAEYGCLLDWDTVSARIEAAVVAAGSNAKWAESVGISPPHAYDVRRGNRSMPDGVLKSLGLRVVKRNPLYRKITHA